MQKKKIANLIMVLIIAMLAAGGGLWAFSQRDAAPAALGTEYHIQKLNDNALTEPGQNSPAPSRSGATPCSKALIHCARRNSPMSRATA